MSNDKILIVDDDAVLLRATARLLQSAGYEVLQAGTGADGLRLASQAKPDLVLLDVVLPDIGGVEVCQRIKANKTLSDTWIVLLSGLKTGPDDQADGLDSGADGYIARPVSNRELLARVRAALRAQAVQAALRESEARFRELFENISSGVAVYRAVGEGQDFVIADINEAGERISRVKREDPIGQSVLQVFPGVKAVGLFDALQRVWKSGQPERLPAAHYQDARLENWVENYVYKLPSGELVAVYDDVTERVQAKDTLQASERLLRDIAANYPNSYLSIIEQDLTVGFTSGQEFKKQGLDPASFVGLSLEQVFGEHAPLVRENYLKTFEGAEIEFELFLNNQYQWYRAVPLVGSDGKIERILTVVENITRRKQAEEAIRAYSEKLEDMVEERTRELRAAQEQLVQREKLAVVGQLAGGVGHELRTPLGNIKNAAYFLNMVLENPDAEVREMLGILEKEVQASERIINSLLDFARGKAPALCTINANQLIQETLAGLVVPAGVAVRSRLEKSQSTIQADPDQLRVVLSNLITNAVQAMPEGGQLDIETKVVKEELAISVADTGVGIPPENLDKLFEPLFTTKSKSIGLGLTLAKTLVEGYGGRIEVESVPGKGTTFTVCLPLAAVQPSDERSCHE